MAYTTITNLRGPEGPEGPQGLPGAEGVPTDEAVATLLGVPSDTNTALLAALQGWAQRAVFNVLDFGAVPNPAVDNGPAFQSAVNAASGVGTVVIPPGEYGMGTRVDLPADTYISGAGATIHRLPGLANMFVNWPVGDTTTPGYDGRSNITIEGVTFDAHGDTLTLAANILTFEHCRNIRLRNCRFLRPLGYHSVELNSTDGAWVTDCSFEGFVPVAGLTEKEAIQIDCANEGSAISGVFDGTPARNLTISGCEFRGYQSLPAHHVAIGSHSRPSTGARYQHITVSSCTIDDVTDRGINCHLWENSIITSTTITGAPLTGIRMSGCVNSKITGCLMSGAAVQGFALTFAGSDNSVSCSIVGSTVVGGNEGIAVTLSRGCTVTGNTTRRTASYGVIVNGSTDTLISGNLIDGAGYPSGALGAIRVTNTNGVPVRTSISGNRVLLHGAGTEVDQGVSVTAVAPAAVDTWVFGNDFKGLAAAYGGPVTDVSNRT